MVMANTQMFFGWPLHSAIDIYDRYLNNPFSGTPKLLGKFTILQTLSSDGESGRAVASDHKGRTVYINVLKPKHMPNVELMVSIDRK